MTIRNVVILSVDVEDWAQSTFDRSLDISPRAERNLHVLLDLLATHNKKATMFVLGKFAETYPKAVRRAAEEGHEIASHGYGHLEIFKQSRLEFRNDVQRSRSCLEDLVGKRPLGYRAPDFSINANSLWALDVLAELGFKYDSSIVPARMKRYGIEDWPASPRTVRLLSGASIVEIPISVGSFFGKRIPIAGGGYHRLLPWPIIKVLIRRTLEKGVPFVNYCHPYELDSEEMDELRMMVPLRTRLHQGIGRKGLRAKLERLICSFETICFQQAIAEAVWPEYDAQSKS